MALNILFAGTPELSAEILSNLTQTEHRIVGILSQPDRKSGRGRKLSATPTKIVALQHDIPVFQYTSLKSEDAVYKIKSLNPDIMIVVAYGLILPKAILDIPKYGCINIHFSLLPKFRGAAPAQYSILSGDAKTGVSIIQMQEGLDDGDVLTSLTHTLTGKETSGSLLETLTKKSTPLLNETLNKVEKHTLIPIKQNESEVTFAHKIAKQQACINWQLSASEIERQIRAYNPWPISFTEFKEKTIRIWSANIICKETHHKPGTVIELDKTGLKVACGQDVLCITMIQLPGGKPIEIKNILNANKTVFAVGMQLG